VPVTARAPRMRLVSGLKQHPGMPCQPTLPYHAAQLVTLDRAADAAALEDYTCSHSMRGVAVELVVAVRPAALVRTVTASLPSDAALPAALLRVQAPYPAASGRDHSLRAMLRQCLFRQRPAGERMCPAFPRAGRFAGTHAAAGAVRCLGL